MKTNLPKFNNQSGGFSTIELLIAFSVGIIFLSASMMVAFADPTLRKQISLDNGQVAALDVALDNNALATSSNRLGKMVANLTGNWESIFSNNSDGFYTNTPEVEDISPCIKRISNLTTWDTLGNRSRQITFGTALSSIEIAETLGRGACDPTPPSDWEKPETSNLAQANVSGADNGTDVEVVWRDGVRYAFITTNPQGSGTNKKEFTVVDVTDTNIENTDIKFTLPAENGLLGVTVFGNYAYVLNNSIENHLQIIDLTNPETPTKLSTSYTLPNITCTYHNQNCQRIATSLAYYNGYLYIGTGYMVGNSPEFHIYCIDDSAISGCTPSTPVFRGSLNVNHDVSDISVQDNNAFLATSANYGELTVVDVTSKSTPTLPPSYSDPLQNNRKFNAVTTAGNPSDEDGTSVYVLGDYAYLGRAKVSNKTLRREFYVLNISNLSNITATGSFSTDINTNGSYISGVHVQGKTGFISTTDSNNSVYIIDLLNPNNPHVRNTCGDVDLSQSTTGLAYRDNVIFLVNTQGSTLLKLLYDEGNACE